MVQSRQERNKQGAKNTVLQLCGEGPDRRREKFIGQYGEYDDMGEVPDKEYKCTVNGVTIDFTDDDTLVIDGEEITRFGASMHTDGRAWFVGLDTQYSISEEGLDKREAGSLERGSKAGSEKLHELCGKIDGKVVPINSDGAPEEGCHIDDAGGRDRLVEEDGDEFVVQFGSVDWTSRYIHRMDESRIQGGFTASKEFEPTEDGVEFERVEEAEIVKDDW